MPGTHCSTLLQGIVPFVAVDCDQESNRPLCSEFGVQVRGGRGRAAGCSMRQSVALSPLLQHVPACVRVAAAVLQCCHRPVLHRQLPYIGRRSLLSTKPQGFPTIKLFTPGSSSPTDYQGPRTAKALADAAVGACC